MNNKLALRKYYAKATAYWPRGYKSEAEAKMEGGDRDRKNFPLYTVEDHLAGRAPYVSVAMDNDAFPYGTALYIPEVCESYGVPWDEITFLVVDTGGAFMKPGQNRDRIDICVGSKKAGYSKVGNMRPVTIYVMEVEQAEKIA